MTIKELAQLLNVSKPTITKALDKLGIKPEKISNRFVIGNKDIEEIIKFIAPEDFEKYLKKAIKTENNDAKDDNIDNIANNNNENTEKSDAKIENKTEKSANTTEQKLIGMLEKALEDKENTIRNQQNTIDNLLKTNMALTAKVTMLEDKSQEPPQDSIIVNEQGTKEEQETNQEQDKNKDKRRWWRKLFGMS